MANEELIADMTYNFLFPAVNNEIERQDANQSNDDYLIPPCQFISDEILDSDSEKTSEINENSESVSNSTLLEINYGKLSKL